MNEPAEVNLASLDSLVSDRPDLRDAVAGLADLESLPLAGHHDRLARVHEALHAALGEQDRD